MTKPISTLEQPYSDELDQILDVLAALVVDVVFSRKERTDVRETPESDQKDNPAKKTTEA